MQKKSLNYALLLTITLVALGISFTFFLYNFIPDAYKKFYIYKTDIWSTSLDFDPSKDKEELVDFIESFSQDNKTNIFAEADARGVLYYSGKSSLLDAYLYEKNPNFNNQENQYNIFVAKSSPLLKHFTDDFVLKTSEENINLAGIIDNDSNPYLFKEQSDADLLIPLSSEYFLSEGTGDLSSIYVPLNNSVDFKDAIEEKFPEYEIWALGPKMEGLGSFLKRVLSTSNQANYMILSLSLIVSALYLIFYYFQSIKPILNVHYHYGLSIDKANIYLFGMHIIIFIISMTLVSIFTYKVRFYSLVTWKQVYLPLFFIVLALIAILIPTWNISRNNKAIIKRME